MAALKDANELKVVGSFSESSSFSERELFVYLTILVTCCLMMMVVVVVLVVVMMMMK